METTASKPSPSLLYQKSRTQVIGLIHGGAWRDPTQTASNYLAPAIAPIYTSATLPHIAAFASIEYRLSPHPSYPQDPKHTKPDEAFDAQHPDHLHDVQAALALLQHKFKFESRYILVGHSAGATLAFQSVMGAFKSGVAPAAILGMAGIYDLRLLRDTHRAIAAYQEFIEGAFGSDEKVWDQASPATVEGLDGVEGGWGAGRLAVLAQSSDDSLVDATQQEAMKRVLARWENESEGRQVKTLALKGDHDDAWEKGDELVRAITFTLTELQKL